MTDPAITGVSDHSTNALLKRGTDQEIVSALDTVLRYGKDTPWSEHVRLALDYLRARIAPNTRARTLLLVVIDNLDSYRCGKWSAVSGFDTYEPVTAALFALRDELDITGQPRLTRPRTAAELAALADRLGVSDWHEPDEQDVYQRTVPRPAPPQAQGAAWVDATDGTFDNAGFPTMEQMAVLYQNLEPVAEVALATLFAWACDAGRTIPSGQPGVVDRATLERVLCAQLGKHTADEVLVALAAETDPNGHTDAPAPTLTPAPALDWVSAGTDDVRPRQLPILDDVAHAFPPGVDKAWSETLVSRLAELDPASYDGWTTAQLATALKPYGITPGQVWATGEDGKGANRRGYLRDTITEALAARLDKP